MRVSGLIALCAVLFAAPALGADRAELALHGYSPDGRYFAFEEFGVQDGSGFAFATIFVVDLATDRWAAGPFEVQAQGEQASVSEARAQALDRASDAFAQYNISAPAVLIALHGDGEIGNDGLTLDFGVPGGSYPGSFLGEYSLSLEIFKAPSPHDCVTYLGDDPMGFALLMSGEGGPTETLHRDSRIPASRFCPTTYRIYGVVVPYGDYSIAHGVALISVYAFGFEGVDRNLIALPLTPPGR